MRRCAGACPADVTGVFADEFVIFGDRLVLGELKRSGVIASLPMALLDLRASLGVDDDATAPLLDSSDDVDGRSTLVS